MEVVLPGRGHLNSIPQIKAGKLRAIGIVGPRRVAALPGVPTLAEEGLLVGLLCLPAAQQDDYYRGQRYMAILGLACLSVHFVLWSFF
ncbi:Tripartite tricarboxylate transporter family receptor [Variovorax sp. PBS-H4]|uniref:tripartite tricarboxylate transporter substrate-binding protein n=1 Tax=Variovorax sp. PBS-H4 TaxID=434008 RepID=UPI001315E8D8|nr:tripartite tricarboxylate transporter substrate-binding protein [Variovorax sp. PBS-H4]VTU27931.1 Tripartite tricarboxylate transporter family receptor [Variovorax sp. PBS-H4]